MHLYLSNSAEQERSQQPAPNRTHADSKRAALEAAMQFGADLSADSTLCPKGYNQAFSSCAAVAH
jgi:hypothetical protein